MPRPRKQPARELSQFHLRLQELVSGSTQADFARRAGISQSGLNKILGGGDPSLATIIALAKAGRVSLEWLVAGVNKLQDTDIIEDFSFVRRYDVRASAGPGALVPLDDLDGTSRFVAFRTEWLRRIGLNARQAEVLIAVGDSMEPTIRDGDLLLIDRGIDSVVDNGIYVLVLGGMVLVKRIQTRRDGSAVLKSDNQHYDDEVIPAAELPELRVEGRVRWYGRTI
ncbi:helix-turn-helix transcriptional regulator [Rhodoplanes sp. TEM]|uniref:Helix-turn-helix transcriptional regulator n=1 Tax=Rhodoplanes tepidamans TaxID=200616 RepID=A0ABT5JE14_RHOTP|nr:MULTISPECIES: helix-turn-helix transcriptional regulator [Rhodoplanes]MDC7787325.1 helix-turn-helix transcriptional regulator [Rhodoplanes tepidamans]MDC7984793.1 helix-turn-helix transcriptional regulator [Rhodoplanes sp. TEM]MDQ0358236.1 phage repressor protein C with HTH and peptisase S24 domain [Rhodoplanes tepidamans]